MPLYSYKAIDEAGSIRRDYLESENEAELEQRLNVMGLELVQCKTRAYRTSLFSNKRPPRQEIINFSFQMQQLTRSGVSILDGLNDLKESLNEGLMKEVLAAIITSIEGGKTFSQALAGHPDVFDTVYVTLVKVGEETGNISVVLKDIAETLQWHDELISHTKKIMIYPSIVSVVVIVVVSFLMIFLVPQLLPFLESIGGEVPMHTRALLAVSNFMGDYWYIIFGLPIISFFIIKGLTKNIPAVRLIVDGLKLRTYIVGPLLLKTSLARFANYFAMMYRSGLTVLDALQISEKLLGNAALEKAIIEARIKISDGEVVSESFKSVKIYPQLVIRMLKVGENTGALDEALMNVSYFYNREVKETIGKLEAAITPILTIILGGIMLWIMSAVLGPVYDSFSQMQL